jgi:SAM-dependent methyltransferase
MTGPAKEWFADDAFWEAMYPVVFSDAARTAAVDEVSAIKALVARPVTTVVDLCCGPGRHSVPFAKQGGRVTGVDRSPFLLDRARQYAAVEGVDVRWVQMDMREFIEPGRFALAVNLFTSFGYLDDPAENQLVLANAYASLQPGGAFVLDLLGKEVVARIFQPCRSQDLPDGGLLVQRARVVDAWARIENDWSVIRNGQVRSFRFRHWLYSAIELRSLLDAVGFVEIDVFGNLEGSAYGVESNRMVVRAYKDG